MGIAKQWSHKWRWSLRVTAITFMILGGVCLVGCPSETQEIRTDKEGGTSKVYALRKQLRSTQASERKAAAEQLGAMGPQAEKAIRALQQTLLDPNAEVKMAAVSALGKIGFKAVPALLYARGRRDPALKKAATDAINRQPDRKQALIAALKDPLMSVRIQAASMLGDMGKGAVEAVPAITKLIRDEETDVRVAAANALRQIGPAGDATPNTVMALGTALKRNKMWWNVRVAISNTLGSYGPKGAGAAAELVPLLASKDTNVHQAATKALIDIGPSAVDALIQRYPGAPWEGKVRIAQIVEKWGPKASKIVVTLASGLRDSDTDVRKAALRALGKMGVAAQPALPKLTKFMTTPGVSRQNWLTCLRVMLEVGDQGVLSIQQLLEGENWELRKRIIEGLAQLGAKVGKRGVPILISGLQHKEKEVRWVSAMTLAKLKENASPALSALIQALKAADATTRKLAAKALGNIGGAAKSALPALKKRTADANASVQAAVREAIAKIQKGGATTSRKPPPRRASDAPTPPRKIK